MPTNSGVAEGQDPGEAADDVPAGGQIGIKEQQDEDVEVGGAADHQRQGEGDREEAGDHDGVEMVLLHCMSPHA